MNSINLPIAQVGDAILRQVATPVTTINSSILQNIIENMIHTMQTAKGVGIAAPQIFLPLRIIVVASRPNERYPNAPLMEPEVMINPEIMWRSAEIETDWEGCLSVPNQREQVPRVTALRVRYHTRDNRIIEREYHGFVARIIQHECDHLDGILFPDRVVNTDDTV